jgi:hypothetical protein
MPTAYITIQQFCTFHQCETIVVEEFLDHGIFQVQREGELFIIPEQELERLERAYRLHTDLGVNAAGIDIILNLLDRLEDDRFAVIMDLE